MSALKNLLVGFLIFFSVSTAQEQPTPHKWQNEQYGSKENQPSLFDPSGKDIIPLVKNKSLSSAVFGYLPDWNYSTYKSYLKYDLLTHIAAFDFTVDSLGNITNPSYWPWTDVIDSSHKHGVKVILCAVSFTNSITNRLLTNTTAKNTFFGNLVSKINQFKLDGVNIDFEGMTSAYRGSILNTFMSDLTAYMHTQIPGCEVSFAGPAVNWGGWDLAGLANACDYIFIMGYDFYGSWSTATGPSAPFSGTTYCISNTINTQYSSVVLSNPKKLILGCPYYGVKYSAKTTTPNAAVLYTDSIKSVLFKDVYANYAKYGRNWLYQTPYYTYQRNDTSYYQVWIDDDSSLAIKYSLAKSKNLRGVGMWALGQDGSLSVLWNLLRNDYYYTPVELSAFSYHLNGSTLTLNWTTATETNNLGFEIYRKNYLGNNTFLYFIKGKGNSTEQNGYSFSEVNATGTSTYYIYQVDYDGTKTLVAEKEININSLTNYMLGNNYPNPFNPSTTINFNIPEDQFVTIKVYDVLGKEVAALLNGQLEKGSHKVNFNASNLASGVYYYSIKAGNFMQTKKMILMK